MEVTQSRLSYLVVLLSGPSLGLFACKRAATEQQASAASGSASAAATMAAPSHQAKADESVKIAGGTFHAGSIPGEPGRDAELEPRRYAVELGPFEIDRLPYPNDPARPPLTNVTRERAKQLCAEREARLCTELEWERACKGPESTPYASGPSWNPQCSQAPLQCASGFDVLSMSSLREWTSSSRATSSAGTEAVARGAAADAPGTDHRCAVRHIVAPDSAAPNLGFRCCRGAPNAARIEEPTSGVTFEKTSIAVPQLAKLLEAHPATRELAKDLKFFREPEAAATVVSRGPGDTKGFSLTVAPLSWRPAAGSEYLLVAARSGETTSFVAAFYALGGGDYQLASSFVMKNEAGPVALAYSNDIRPRLHFSTCWGCPGETGKILHRRPDHVVILQP